MGNENLSITAVVVSFCTGVRLFEAISSLLGQEGISEIIIVNNGNPAPVEARLREFANKEKRLVVISGHGNVGFAAGCNLGVGKATGKWLLLMNPDGVLSAGSVARMLEEGRRLDRPWMLGCRLVNPDGSEQRGGRREILTPGNAVVEALGLYRLLPGVFGGRRLNRHQEPLPEGIAEVPAISGACMMMPLDDYRAVGGMDEGYFLHVEDLDFCLRFRQAGGKIFFCPDVVLRHAQGSSEVSPAFVEWHKVRSLRYYFRRHFAGRTLPGLIPLVNLCAVMRFLVIVALGMFQPRSR